MSSRMPVIIGNWKMNKSCDESVIASKKLLCSVSRVSGIEIILAPAFTALFSVKNVLKGSNILLAAQDVFYEDSGSFTGEISTGMLKNVGCSYVILGHSERRKFFCETNIIVNKKIISSLKAGIFPILCVGEDRSNRKKGKTFPIIKRQLEESLESINKNDIKKIVFAYEPVWAIGTGMSASEYQVQEVHLFIRSYLEEMYSCDLADNVRVVYGGSVTSENVERLISTPDVDGVLVGGASLDSKIFSKLVHSIDILTNKI